MEKLNKDIDELSRMLDTMVRMKIMDKLDKNIKYLSKAMNKLDLKTCDIEKLDNLNKAFDDARFILHDMTKEKQDE